MIENHRPQLIQLQVHYTGQVQGVGFRYATARMASRYAVSGYVQNLSDGRVRLMVEGEQEEVQRFVDAVSHEMGRYIRHQVVEKSAASGKFGTPGLAPLTIRR